VLHTYNLEIYAGKQPDGQYPHSNKPTDVIKRLVEPINSTGWNIMAVNWFMDVNWVFELRKRKLSCVDTLKKNKPHLPVEFVAVKNRPEKSSLFHFRKAATVVSYIPRKAKTSFWLHHNIFMMPLSVKQAVNWSQKLQLFITEQSLSLITWNRCSTYNVGRSSRGLPMVILRFWECYVTLICVTIFEHW
jgi:hypothetical protein